MEYLPWIILWSYDGNIIIALQTKKNNIINKIQKLISNSWGKHKANQYHDGELIPDKTYWRQKEY